MKSDLCVLGSGWAGLLCARRALNLGINNVVLIDKSTDQTLGGLLQTEIIREFTFDCGGPHLIFSKDPYVLSELVNILGTNVSKRQRNNYVLYDGKYVPYPFENGIYVLEPHQRIKFVRGIIDSMLFNAKNENWKPTNFLDWITGFFGDYMASEYLIPYNLKIWKRPLDKMAADWVFTPGRLPFPELENMLMAVSGIPNVGYKEQSYYYYPKTGGIFALFESVAKILSERAKFVTGVNVNKIVVNADGTKTINDKIVADRIISTIPLPELLLSLDENYKELSEKFDYNSVVIVGIAIKGKTPNQTAVYVPDPKVIFHRYTWMSSLTPTIDNEYSNLIAEVTVPKGERVYLNEIGNNVIKGLINLGVIDDENSILFYRVWINKYGYPIYTLNHNEVRKKAFDTVNKYGIKSVGRWGSWHYWNTDMVYKAVQEMSFNL